MLYDCFQISGAFCNPLMALMSDMSPGLLPVYVMSDVIHNDIILFVGCILFYSILYYLFHFTETQFRLCMV